MKKQSITPASPAVTLPAPAPVTMMMESPAPVMPAAPVELSDSEKLAAALKTVADLTALLEKQTAPPAAVNVTVPGIDLSKKFFTDNLSHVEVRNIATGALISTFPADEASAWAVIAYATDRKEIVTEFKKTLAKKSITLASGAVVQLGTLDSTKTALVMQWKSPTMDAQAQSAFRRIQRKIRHAQELIDLAAKQAAEEAADSSPFLFFRKYTKAAGDDTTATAPAVTATAPEEITEL
jgi:hypothetical protein